MVAPLGDLQVGRVRRGEPQPRQTRTSHPVGVRPGEPGGAGRPLGGFAVMDNLQELSDAREVLHPDDGVHLGNLPKKLLTVALR